MPHTFTGLLLVLLAVSAVPVSAAAGAEADSNGTADELTGTAPAEHSDETTAEHSGGFLAYEEPSPHPRRSFASLMLRLVLSMAIILGIIYGGLMLVKLLTRRAKGAPKAERLVRVVDRTALDAKRAIYLVKVCDRLLVIGVGTSEIRTLAEIADEAIVENVQETEFSGHLQSLLGRLAGRQN
jgi:flagellar biogenesis protein FliO